jgi:hypothetical protein
VPLQEAKLEDARRPQGRYAEVVIGLHQSGTGCLCGHCGCAIASHAASGSPVSRRGHGGDAATIGRLAAIR